VTDRRRRFDPLSLIAATAFVALGIVWLAAGDDTYLDVARFVAPGALIASGVVVLAGRARPR
jgi:hypothetical protein